MLRLSVLGVVILSLAAAVLGHGAGHIWQVTYTIKNMSASASLTNQPAICAAGTVELLDYRHVDPSSCLAQSCDWSSGNQWRNTSCDVSAPPLAAAPAGYALEVFYAGNEDSGNCEADEYTGAFLSRLNSCSYFVSNDNPGFTYALYRCNSDLSFDRVAFKTADCTGEEVIEETLPAGCNLNTYRTCGGPVTASSADTARSGLALVVMAIIVALLI